MRQTVFLILIIFSITEVSGQMLPGDGERRMFRADTLRLNNTEVELAKQINEYRQSRNLPAIRLSASLSLVARVHVYDLSKNYKPGKSCNLHSWSAQGYWSSCCYTPDHRRAACMWDKPRELTDYQGDGYEIAFFSNYQYNSAYEEVADALKGWKESRGHHELIVNKGKWDTADWQAMGVGAYGGFVVVWFGEETDPAGVPALPGK